MVAPSTHYTVRMRPLVIVLALLSGVARPVFLQAAQGTTAVGTSLPAEIPLFPLPQVVLFPRVRRPLMIVEPRYREMVADALKGDGIIGMVLLRPGFERDYEGRPPIYDIGCAGEIDNYQQLPDGRYAILLRGLTTFRVLRETQGKAYRLARVEAIPERLPDEDRGALSAVRKQLAQALYNVGLEAPDERLDDAEFVDVAAETLTSMPEATRQDLLERNRVLSRATALREWLEGR